jgi:hypothetical protein
MRRAHVDLGFGFGVDPVILNPVAGKFEAMNATPIGNGQLYPPIGRHRAD